MRQTAESGRVGVQTGELASSKFGPSSRAQNVPRSSWHSEPGTGSHGAPHVPSKYPDPSSCRCKAPRGSHFYAVSDKPGRRFHVRLHKNGEEELIRA